MKKCYNSPVVLNHKIVKLRCSLLAGSQVAVGGEDDIPDDAPKDDDGLWEGSARRRSNPSLLDV